MELEGQCRDWIAAVVEEPFPEGTFHEALKDGTLLCRLVSQVLVLLLEFTNQPIRTQYSHHVMQTSQSEHSIAN